MSDKSLLFQLRFSEITIKKLFVKGETKNIEDAFNIFKFVSDNTGIEWNLAAFKNKENTRDYVLSTSFREASSSEERGERKATDLIFHIHNHPNDLKTASGYELYSNGILNGDAEFMHYHFTKAKEANKKWPSEYPRLYMYHVKSNGVYHYNHKTSSEYIGKALNSISLKNMIKNHKLKP